MPTPTKTIKIQTRANALKMLNEHPDATKGKYSSGKYQWLGSQSHYVGKEETVSERVLALWVERRSDRDGAYAQVMCIVKE